MGERDHTGGSWLVTGGAGFIGVATVRRLLERGARVRVLDDFSTGSRDRLAALSGLAAARPGAALEVLEGSVTDPQSCSRALDGVERVVHLAAISSVSASISDPLRVHLVNERGFLVLMERALAAGVGRVVFASSAAVYGDGPDPVKSEASAVDPLSPYAVSKYANELHSAMFARHHGLPGVALRYFNVYGPGQDPASPYSGVTSIWLKALAEGAPTRIFGDGASTRDFCFVDDVAEANVSAALAPGLPAGGEAYNIGTGRSTSVAELHGLMAGAAAAFGLPAAPEAGRGPARPGEVRHSRAEPARAHAAFGFAARTALPDGLRRLFAWHLGRGPAA